jgi:hypothetical protein
MSGYQFWVQRDERTCKVRCREIQDVLSSEGPSTKKFQEIFGLMDKYTDEDSDVTLLNGIQIPASGPVFIPEGHDGSESAAAAEGRSPKSAAGDGDAAAETGVEMQPPVALPAAGSSSPGSASDLSKTLAVVEAKRKEALKRRDAMREGQKTAAEEHTSPAKEQWNVRWM